MAEEETKSPANTMRYTYYDFLTLRPPIPDVVKAVPKPRGAIIKNGLPMWNIRPLDTKLPLLPGPDGPVVFSRGKVGTNLWKSTKETDFMLDDPYGYKYSFEYEPLHDKHLRKWLKNSKNQNNLLKQGLVTTDTNVKCSVNQYNEYRKYLQRIHSNAIKTEAIRREDENLVKMVDSRAHTRLQKEVIKLKRLDGQVEKKKENITKRQQNADVKKQNCERRRRRIAERNACLEEKKKENLNQSIKRRRAKNEFIQNRITSANKLERNRKIHTLRRWRDTDVEKKRKKEVERVQKQVEMAQKAKERWEKKVENQKKQIEKEEFLHRQRKYELETSRRLRMKKIETDLACEREKLFLLQGQPIVKSVIHKFKKKQKKIMDTVQKTFFSQVSKRYTQDAETLENLNKKIKNMVSDIRFDMEPYLLISEVKKRLETDIDIPESVSLVLKSMMEEVIVIAVAKKLENLMYKITQTILISLDKIRFSQFPQEGQKDTRKSFKQPTEQSFEDIKQARVRFGDMVQVSRDDNLSTEISGFKSIRNRPPTPVSSVATITAAAMNDPIIEIPITFVEQRDLMKSIDDLSKWMTKNVTKCVHRIAQSMFSKQLISQSFFVKYRHQRASMGSAVIPRPLVRLCGLILFSTNDNFEDILDTIVKDVIIDIKYSPTAGTTS